MTGQIKAGEHKARGVTVDAIDQTHLKRIATALDHPLLQLIHQRTGEITARLVREYTGWLIEHQKSGVFMENAQCGRRRAILRRGYRSQQFDAISRLKLIPHVSDGAI